MEIFKEFTFDSAHSLPKLPESHKCHHMHGHTYIVRVYVSGNNDNEYGWIVDFGDIKKVVKPVIELLDHKVLNDIEGLENSTSENLAKWIWNKIKPELPLLSKIIVQETPSSGVIYKGE